MGEERETVEEVAEPFLVRSGLLARTPRGRVATPAAWQHLGLACPGDAPFGAAGAARASRALFDDPTSDRTVTCAGAPAGRVAGATPVTLDPRSRLSAALSCPVSRVRGVSSVKDLAGFSAVRPDRPGVLVPDRAARSGDRQQDLGVDAVDARASAPR